MNPRTKHPAALPSPPSGIAAAFEVGRDGIGLITLRDPDRVHNVLTVEALEALTDAVGAAEEEAAAGALRALMIRSARPGSFMAGADLDAVAAASDGAFVAEMARRLQALMDRIEALPVPTAAAIQGVCLGAGMAVALACDHRFADDGDDTRMGLPEVRVGLLPGGGDTVRLPRLVGLAATLDLMLTGKPARTSKARRIGLVDAVLPRSQFERRSLELVRALAREEVPALLRRRRRPMAARILDGTAPGRALALRAARRRVLRRTGGRYPAPLRIVDVLARGRGRSDAERLDMEARAFGELAVSPTCKNLLFVFRLRQRARKGPWTREGQAAACGAAARRAGAAAVERIAVIGAGPMGGGIAQIAAYNDIAARLKDVRHEAVAAGLARARSIFDGAVRRRSLRRREAERRMGLISGAADYSGVGAAQVVVEAVVERLDVKRAVLAEVEEVVAPDAVIATNTSSLRVDDLAEALERPGRFAGMHFFNPVHRMPLVEVVRGAKTGPEAVETLAALAVRLGKVPVVVRDAPGFLVNRILAPCLNEAVRLLEEGWDGRAVDRAWRDFGMPMGPLRLIDEIGIDVAAHAGGVMAQAFGDRMAAPESLAALASSGRTGRKGGRGFYRYSKGREKDFDATVYADMGLSPRRSAGRAPQAPGPGARFGAADRMALAMANEAARALEEGVARTAGDVDLGMVMGTGFAPFRGGLLKYADDRGLADVLGALEELRDMHGARYEPSPLLAELAEAGETFHGAFPARDAAP